MPDRSAALAFDQRGDAAAFAKERDQPVGRLPGSPQDPLPAPPHRLSSPHRRDVSKMHGLRLPAAAPLPKKPHQSAPEKGLA